MENNLEESVCKHFRYCSVARLSGRDCSLPEYKDCQTYKFWKKFPVLLEQVRYSNKSGSADFSTNAK